MPPATTPGADPAAEKGDVPWVIALPIIGGNPRLLRWLRDETDPADQRAALSTAHRVTRARHAP